MIKINLNLKRYLKQLVNELTSFIDGLDLYNYWYAMVFQGLFTMAAVLKDEVFMAF